MDHKIFTSILGRFRKKHCTVWGGDNSISHSASNKAQHRVVFFHKALSKFLPVQLLLLPIPSIPSSLPSWPALNWCELLSWIKLLPGLPRSLALPGIRKTPVQSSRDCSLLSTVQWARWNSTFSVCGGRACLLAYEKTDLENNLEGKMTKWNSGAHSNILTFKSVLFSCPSFHFHKWQLASWIKRECQCTSFLEWGCSCRGQWTL